MRKLTLALASVAGLSMVTMAAPAYAQGVSLSIGDRPAVRERVIVDDRDRGWRSHRAQSDVVIIKKKRKPAKKTVIIER